MVFTPTSRRPARVMPRKRHVSRNDELTGGKGDDNVMPRKRHVSRNHKQDQDGRSVGVMPRKRHVSRNGSIRSRAVSSFRHASQEACE